MATLALVIADKALSAAIVEQLQGACLGDSVTNLDLAQACDDTEVAAIVVDAALFDKKNAKPPLINRDLPAKPIFLLGQAPAGFEFPFAETLPKPLRLGQLLLRLRYHLEIVPRLRSRPVQFAGYRLEPQNRQLVSLATGVTIRLTEKETALLAFLGLSEQPVNREDLLAAVWGYEPGIDTHTLETHIYQLRRKLDPDSSGDRILVNEQGCYRLER